VIRRSFFLFTIAVSEEELKAFQTSGQLTVAGHLLDTDDVKVFILLLTILILLLKRRTADNFNLVLYLIHGFPIKFYNRYHVMRSGITLNQPNSNPILMERSALNLYFSNYYSLLLNCFFVMFFCRFFLI